MTKGLLGEDNSLRFAAVLDPRRARSDQRVAPTRTKFAFGTVLSVRQARSDERVVSRWGPADPTPRKKKNKFLTKSNVFSAAFLSSLSAFFSSLLGSLSQQPFLAAFFSSFSQQLFSAPFFSSLSQQLSQQPFSAAFLSSLSQQPFSAAFLSNFSHQLFSAAILSYHLAVVSGWWSAINIILLRG